MFIRVLVGSLGRSYVSPGSFGLAWVHSGAPRCRSVHFGSLVIIPARVGVSRFIWVCVASLGSVWGSPGSFGFARVGSVRGFISARLVSLRRGESSLGRAKGRLVHLVSLGFTRARLEVAWLLRVRLGSLWSA